MLHICICSLQKNIVPGVINTLGSKDALCQTMTAARHLPSKNLLKFEMIIVITKQLNKPWSKIQFHTISALKVNEVVPPCYNLPEQLDSLLNAADGRGAKEKWIFKPLNQSKPNMLLEPTKMRDFNKIQKWEQFVCFPCGKRNYRYLSKANHLDSSDLKKMRYSIFYCITFRLVTGGQRLVVQQYQDHPRLLFGMPFSVTTFVLVTSLTPLRAYMHSQGIVQYRYDYQKNFKKVTSKLV